MQMRHGGGESLCTCFVQMLCWGRGLSEVLQCMVKSGEGIMVKGKQQKRKMVPQELRKKKKEKGGKKKSTLEDSNSGPFGLLQKRGHVAWVAKLPMCLTKRFLLPPLTLLPNGATVYTTVKGEA